MTTRQKRAANLIHQARAKRRAAAILREVARKAMHAARVGGVA